MKYSVRIGQYQKFTSFDIDFTRNLTNQLMNSIFKHDS